MIKLLTAVLALTLSISATANDDWSLNENGVAVSVGKNERKEAWLAAYNVNSKKTITFIEIDQSCYHSDVFYSNQIVENTKVKFERFCINYKEAYTPSTEAGGKFIMDQFSKKLRIEFRDVVFTGKGFNKAIKDSIAFHEDDAL